MPSALIRRQVLDDLRIVNGKMPADRATARAVVQIASMHLGISALVRISRVMYRNILRLHSVARTLFFLRLRYVVFNNFRHYFCPFSIRFFLALRLRICSVTRCASSVISLFFNIAQSVAATLNISVTAVSINDEINEIGDIKNYTKV